MTAPNYPDKDEVGGIDRAAIERMNDPNAFTPLSVLARTALLLWDERDKARQTVAMQDDVIQKATIVFLKLEALRKLAATLNEVMVAGDICGEPFSQTLRKAWDYACERGDSGEAIGLRLEQAWQSLQEIEITTAKVLEELAKT